MAEQLLALILVLGLVLIGIAWVWLLIRAFRTSVWWGLASLLFGPALLVFALSHWKNVKRPATLLVVGVVVAAVPFGINLAQQKLVGLGPHAAQVDGEWHITVTGWDRTDYRELLQRPDAVVIQMANPDVTDTTLELLKQFPHLREVDLSGTQVTDAGLATLAELQLQTLRMKGTAITDAGFQRYLSAKSSLVQLDLRETGVAAKTLRTWKNAQSGRQYLK